MPGIARYELAVAERNGLEIGGLKDVVEHREERIAEIPPEREQMVPGHGEQAERRAKSESEETRRTSASNRGENGDHGKPRDVNRRRVFQAKPDARRQSRQGKAAPCGALARGFGDDEKAEQRAQHENRIDEIVRRGSEQRYEAGTGDADQRGCDGQCHAHRPLARAQDVHRNRRNEDGIEAVHRAHGERDDPRRLVQDRRRQPVKQKVGDRIEEALGLRGPDIIEVSPMQIGPRRIEMVVSQIPIVVGTEQHRQQPADRHEPESHEPAKGVRRDHRHSAALQRVDCSLLDRQFAASSETGQRPKRPR